MLNINFILVSLINLNLEKISIALAKKIKCFYLNMEELIDYSLVDKKRMEEVCGIDYMEKQEMKIVKSINDYENTVASMKYETFSKNFSHINKEKNKIIYLSISQANFDKYKTEFEIKNDKDKFVSSDIEILSIAFKERDKFMKKNCNIEVKCDISNVKETVKLVYEKIGK